MPAVFSFFMVISHCFLEKAILFPMGMCYNFSDNEIIQKGDLQ